MPPLKNSGFVATTPFLCFPKTRSQKKKDVKQEPLTSTLVGSMEGDVPPSLRNSLVEGYVGVDMQTFHSTFFFLGYPAINYDFLKEDFERLE